MVRATLKSERSGEGTYVANLCLIPIVYDRKIREQTTRLKDILIALSTDDKPDANKMPNHTYLVVVRRAK